MKNQKLFTTGLQDRSLHQCADHSATVVSGGPDGGDRFRLSRSGLAGFGGQHIVDLLAFKHLGGLHGVDRRCYTAVRAIRAS